MTLMLRVQAFGITEQLQLNRQPSDRPLDHMTLISRHSYFKLAFCSIRSHHLLFQRFFILFMKYFAPIFVHLFL